MEGPAKCRVDSHVKFHPIVNATAPGRALRSPARAPVRPAIRVLRAQHEVPVLKIDPLLEVIGWDAGLGRSAALRGECNERATPPAGFFGRPAEGTGEAVFSKTKPRYCK